jgi:hypothetical protein
MNKTISLFFALSLLVSCGQGTQKKGNESGDETRLITVSDFLSHAGPMVDQTVQISGTVVHVCRQGGQRLFIVGEDGEQRVRITTGDNIAQFSVELEGETVAVTGVVRELIIDDTYLAEWEADVLEGSTSGRGEGHEGGVGHSEGQGGSLPAYTEQTGDQAETAGEKESQLARIQQLRDEIAKSGKDHLSDYWVETLTYRVIKD